MTDDDDEVAALTVLGELVPLTHGERLVEGEWTELRSTFARMTPVEAGLCVKVGDPAIEGDLTTLLAEFE